MPETLKPLPTTLPEGSSAEGEPPSDVGASEKLEREIAAMDDVALIERAQHNLDALENTDVPREQEDTALLSYRLANKVHDSTDLLREFVESTHKTEPEGVSEDLLERIQAHLQEVDEISGEEVGDKDPERFTREQVAILTENHEILEELARRRNEPQPADTVRIAGDLAVTQKDTGIESGKGPDDTVVDEKYDLVGPLAQGGELEHREEQDQEAGRRVHTVEQLSPKQLSGPTREKKQQARTEKGERKRPTVKWKVTIEKASTAEEAAELKRRRDLLDTTLRGGGVHRIIMKSDAKKNLKARAGAEGTAQSLLNNKQRLEEGNLKRSIEFLEKTEHDNYYDSFFDILRETQDPDEVEMIRTYGAALLDEHYREHGQVAWARLSSSDKDIVRLGEMVILAAEQKKIELALQKGTPFSERDRKSIKDFGKVVEKYLQSEDIPSSFKKGLRETIKQVADKHPDIIRVETRKRQGEHPPQAPRREPEVEQPPEPQQIWTVPIPEAKSSSAHVIGSHLESMSANEREEYYNRRLAVGGKTLAQIREKDPRGMKHGMKDANELFSDNVIADWYATNEDKLKTAVSRPGSEAALGENCEYGTRFIDTLDEQLRYNDVPWLDKRFAEAELFVGNVKSKVWKLWRLGGIYDRRGKMFGIRNEIADNLRMAARDESMSNKDRVVFLRLAAEIDDVNRKSLEMKH